MYVKEKESNWMHFTGSGLSVSLIKKYSSLSLEHSGKGQKPKYCERNTLTARDCVSLLEGYSPSTLFPKVMYKLVIYPKCAVIYRKSIFFCKRC